MPKTLQERMAARAKKAAVEGLKEQAQPLKDGEDPNLLGVPEAPPEKPEPPPGRVLTEGEKPKQKGQALPGSVQEQLDRKASPDGVRSGLKGKRFFDKIRSGELDIDDAMPYWRRVVEDSHQHLAFRGNFQDLLAETPGLAFFYRTILTDAQQVRRYLEMKAEQTEIAKYKWLMTSEEAKKEFGALKTTEAAKFAKADEEVLNANMKVRIMAEIEHHLDSVALGFQDRSIMLSRIVTVRESGHQEVFIDSRIETDNR